MVEIDENLAKLRTLVEQYRLDETMELADQTSTNLSQTNSELEQLEQATEQGFIITTIVDNYLARL